MEQYELRPKDCNKNIQTALKYFTLENLFIRRVGSQGGGVVIDKNLKNCRLVIKYSKKGFEFVIDGKKVFLFEFNESAGDDYVWGKKWSLAYERIWRIKIIIAGHSVCREKLNYASTGYPYLGSIYESHDDPRLPEPKKTTLRCANSTHFVVITFNGKIQIRKTKYKMPGVCDYYEIGRARLPKNTAST